MKTKHHIIKYTLSAIFGIITLYSCEKQSKNNLEILTDNEEVPIYFNVPETVDKSQLSGSLNSTSKEDSTVIIDNSIPGLTIKVTSKKVNNSNAIKDKLAQITKLAYDIPYMLYAYDKDGNYVKSKLMNYTKTSTDTMWLKPNATYTFVAYTHRLSSLTGISYPNTLTADLSSARISTNANTQDGKAAVMMWKGEKLILPNKVTSHDNRLNIAFKPVSSRLFALGFSFDPSVNIPGRRTMQMNLHSTEGPYLSPMHPNVVIDFQNQNIIQKSGTIIKKPIIYDNTWANAISTAGYFITGYNTNPDGSHYVNVVFTTLKIRNFNTLKEMVINSTNLSTLNQALKIPITPGEDVYFSFTFIPNETILAQLMDD